MTLLLYDSLTHSSSSGYRFRSHADCRSACIMASSVAGGSRKGSPRKYDDIQCAKTSKQYPLLALNCHDGVSSSDGFTNGKNAHHGAVDGEVPLE